MAHQIIIIAISFVIAAVISSNLSGQEKDPLASFKKETLEAYLDRGDRESSSDNWLRFAEMGREAAIAQWEQEALLAMQGADLDAARSAVEAAIGSETGDRYREWLVASFARRVAPAGLEELRRAIAKQNGSLLYERASDSSVLVDSSGDPILKALEGLEGDETDWKANVGMAIDDSVAAWRASFEAAFPELLALVPESERRELESCGASNEDLYGAAYRRELEALSQQEERRFVALRSFDQYSLRKKSEDQTAGATTDRLIAEAQGATEAGIRRLRDSLTLETGAGTGEAGIDATAWQASFRQILEEGLAIWDKSGKQLLAERVEWEGQAEKNYVDGEKSWAAAYERFQAEKEKWQAEIRAVLETGQAAWANKKSELEGAIAQAGAELDREIQDRKAAKADEVSCLVDVYAQSASMVATARESAAYWFKRLGIAGTEEDQDAALLTSWGAPKLDGYVDALAVKKRSASEQEAIAAGYDAAIARMKAIKDGLATRALSADELASLDSDLALCARESDYSSWESYYQEAAYWVGVEATYAKYNRDAKSELTDTFSRVISDDGAAKSLLGIAGNEAGLEGVCLDEYQVELLKAEALSEYWDKQVEVANKVYAYAATVSSERLTSAQTAAQYDQALADYTASQGAYRDTLDALESEGERLGSAKDALAEKRGALADAKSKVEAAEWQYETLQALFMSNNVDYFKEELTSDYKALLESLDLENDEKSLAMTMASYLAAARKYGYDQTIELGNKDLELLVSGGTRDGSPKVESLASLREKVASAVVPANGAQLEDVKIEASSVFAAAFEEAKSGYFAAASAGESSDQTLYLGICESIALQYRASLQSALDEREDAIRLLTSSSAEQWYQEETGRAIPGDVIAAAAVDAKEAAGRYLAARADLEAKAYGSVAAVAMGMAGDATKGEQLLALAVSGKVTGASAKQEALAALSAFLKDGHANLETSRSALYDFIANYAASDGLKDFLRGFASGRTEFYIAIDDQGTTGIDLAAGCLIEEQRSRDRALRIPTLLERYAQDSLAFAPDLEAAGMAELKAALGSSGLLAPGVDLSFVAPPAAWNIVAAESAADRETWLVGVLASARKAETKLAGCQADRLEAYLSDLESYFATREALAGDSVAGEAAAAKRELDKLKSELDVLGGLEREASSVSDRFSSLTRLFAWASGSTSAPAADLAAARACLVEAGAAKVLDLALLANAFPSAPLDSDSTWDAVFDAAFDSAFGANAASLSVLRPDVSARAKELYGIDSCLQGTKEATTEGEKKAFAYALWKEPSLAAGEGSLAVNEHGGLIASLWDFLGSSTGLGNSYAGSPEELAKVDTFLLGLAIARETKDADGKVTGCEAADGCEEEYELVLSLLSAVAAGPEKKEEVFLTALCPSLAASLAEARKYSLSGGEAFERKLAIDLATKVSGDGARNRYGLILSLSGLRTYGTISDDWFGSTQDDSLGLALSSLSGTYFDEIAKVFQLKRRAVSGAYIDADPLMNSLSAGAKAEIDDFKTLLEASRLFIRGTGQTELEYALAAGAGDMYKRLEISAVAAGGESPDLFYIARLGTGFSTSDYRASLAKALLGSDSAFDGGLASEALSLLAESLRKVVSDTSARHAEAAARCELRCARDAALESDRSDYRSYLDSEAYFKSEKKGDTLPESALATDAAASDSPSCIFHAKAIGALDRALEAALALASSSSALAAALERPGADELAKRDSDYSAYAAAMAKFLGPKATSTWIATTDSIAMVDSRNDYQAAATALAAANGKIAELKSEIARIGEGIDRYNAGKTQQEKALGDLKARVDAERTAYEAANAELAKGSDDFGKEMVEYNERYAASRQSYGLMESARQKLNIAEGINDYAESAYLKLDGAASGSYRSPSEEKSYAETKCGAAHAVVDALTELYDSKATIRDADTPGILAFRQSYRAYIELARLQSRLDRAIASQQSAADEAMDNYYGENWGAAFGAPTMGAAYTPKDLTKTDASGIAAVSWTDLVDMSESGLRLNYDMGSFKLAQNSEASYVALNAYFSNPTSEADPTKLAGYAKASEDFAAYIVNCGDYDALMKSWSLAYGYLQGKLFGANCASGIADADKSALQRALEKAGCASSDAARFILDGDLARLMEAGNEFKDVTADYKSWIDAEGKTAYDEISKDPAQKTMFDFMVASKMLGSAKATGMLDEKSTIELYAELVKRVGSKEAGYKSGKETALTASAISYGMGLGLCWLPLAAAPFFATAAILYGVAGDYESKENTCSDVVDRLDAALSASGYQSLYAKNCGKCSANMKNCAQAYQAWEKESATLAALKGVKADGQALDAGEAIAALTEAMKVLNKDSSAALNDDERGYIASIFATGKIRASDASGALADCVAEALDLRDRAKATLDNSVADCKAAQQRAEAAYDAAVKAYMDGDPGSGVAEVRSAAKAAFGQGDSAKSAYAEIAYESDLADAYDDLSSGAPGSDRLYEASKAGALASYAAAVNDLFAARLAALKEAREAEWDLRVQDLADKKAAWTSMTDATISEAARAWKEGNDKLEAAYQAWNKEFQREYREKDAQWSEAYLSFSKRERAWADDLASKAAKVGSDEILAEAGMSAEVMSRDTTIVSGMGAASGAPDGVASGLLGDMRLSRSLAILGKRNATIASLGCDLRKGLGADAGASATKLAASFQAAQDEELSARAALIVADQARVSLAKAKRGYIKIVTDANDGFEESMDEIYLGNAFQKTGGAYVRDAIVDATAFGSLKESQRVETYRKFAVPDFETRASLDRNALEGLGSEAIQARLEAAIGELDDQREGIFGKDDGSDA